MKKILSLALVIFILLATLFSSVSCGKGGDIEESSQPTATTGQQNSEDVPTSPTQKDENLENPLQPTETTGQQNSEDVPTSPTQKDETVEKPSQPTVSTCQHNYTDTVTPPTHKDKGYTTHTCSLCGDSYIDTYVDAIVITGPVETITLQYDDYVPSLNGINPSSTTVIFEGDDCIEVKTYNGITYFHAKGIGTATLTDGNVRKNIVVKKAKLHFVMIMGQSNAGNHFANATSDIFCAPGTAYSLVGPQTNPELYTSRSKGFHTPLVAELYAQSVAAGDPVKPVLIWNEGITSKNGKAITAWAKNADDASGTDDAAAMVKKATEYFTARSDCYEIVHKGVYWIQGESDERTDPTVYTQCFMAMWNKLQAAGMEYVAFLRVRGNVNSQGVNLDHYDTPYHCALSAQIHMANTYDNMYMCTTITENWVGVASTSHSIDVSQYITIMDKYGDKPSFSDSYGNTATFKDGVITTTMKTLFGSNNKCHYGKFGAAIMGADAAYNMYRALNGNKFAIVQADTSGAVAPQTTSNPGQTKTINISSLAHDISFRAACDSIAGKISIKVTSNGTDITSGVTITEGNHYYALSTEALKSHQNVVITVTYTPANKSIAAGSVTYTVVNN